MEPVIENPSTSSASVRPASSSTPPPTPYYLPWEEVEHDFQGLFSHRDQWLEVRRIFESADSNRDGLVSLPSLDDAIKRHGKSCVSSLLGEKTLEQLSSSNLNFSSGDSTTINYRQFLDLLGSRSTQDEYAHQQQKRRVRYSRLDPFTDSELDSLFINIQKARVFLKGKVVSTPLDHSTTFSQMVGCEVYLKAENLQKTGSFKVRGALTAMSRLTDKERENGVVAVSAGNHAQAVAFAATSMGVSSTVVMPRIAPKAKVKATQGYGAKVVLHGDNFGEAAELMKKISIEENRTPLHPYDNIDVVSGQGSVGLEILEALPDVDYVLVPIGGGGIATGVATAVKRISPQVTVYGVEVESADSMKKSFETGKIVNCTAVDTICDGIAIKSPSPLTFKLAQRVIDKIYTVNDLDASMALFYLMERCKLVNEPASCVTVAALLSGKIKIPKGKKVCCVLTGGNIDMTLLTRIVDQQLFSFRRRVTISGIFSDRVGSLARVLQLIGEHGCNCVDLHHERTNPSVMPNKAELWCTVDIPDDFKEAQLLAALKSELDLNFQDMRITQVAPVQRKEASSSSSIAKPPVITPQAIEIHDHTSDTEKVSKASVDLDHSSSVHSPATQPTQVSNNTNNSTEAKGIASPVPLRGGGALALARPSTPPKRQVYVAPQNPCVEDDDDDPAPKTPSHSQ